MSTEKENKFLQRLAKTLKRLPMAVKILLGIALGYLLLVGIGAALIVADPVQHVDAVAVLSGDDGDRLGLAIDMLERGYTTRLVLTDTTNTANARLKQEAIAGGFSTDRIYLTDMRVDSTVDEAQAILELAQAEHWDALMIVTDPYHSLRTRTIFRDAFTGSGITILVRPVVGHWFRSTTWFTRADGWRFAMLEITKLISYWFGIN